MHLKFLIIPSLIICQAAAAQNGSASLTLTQANTTTPAPASTTTPLPATVTAVSSPVPEAAPAVEPPGSSPATLLDYKSVYEAATIEEEVKMAAERFNLTPAQQEVWHAAALDRRQSEQFARDKLNAKGGNLEKESVYRGLRSSQNTFHETIIGYLTPTQKQAFESDRLVLQEKQKRLAKMPPAPPAPTVTVAPVDSSAVKDSGKTKGKSKKSKKKARPVKQ
jgi:hypothetical protein